MKSRTTILPALTAVILAAGLSACAAPSDDQTASAEETRAVAAESTPTPQMTELPAWAQSSGPWIIYPHDFKCYGTEGCGNDFRAAFGDVPWPLPANVEYYGGPTTQQQLAQGFDPAEGGGWWDDEDLEHLAALGYPTELPLPAVIRNCPTWVYPEDVAPFDRGVMAGATGAVVGYDDEGNPAAYEVAPNDSTVAIGERFCIDYATLGPRNGGELGMIHPGDVLNLRR